MSVVMSFPGDIASADPDAVREWERRSVAWLRKELGPALKTVVRHVDEAHPHLHAYGWNDAPGMSATALHPGFSAKAAALAAGGDNHVGDRAYREAMRTWQDRYWQDVGLPCGLARIGPGRRRLTREEWHKEKTAHRAVWEARRSTKRLTEQGKAYIAQTRAAAAAVAASAKHDADLVQVEARQLWFEAKKQRDAAARQQRTLDSIGARIGGVIAAVRSFLTGHDTKLEERVRQDAAVAQRALEVEVAAEKTSAQAARREVQKLKTSLAETSAEAAALRRENAELQRPEAASQQTRSFRPV